MTREHDPNEPKVLCTRAERRTLRKRAIHLAKTCPFYDGSKAGRRFWFASPKSWARDPEDDYYKDTIRSRGDRWWQVFTSADEFGRVTVVFPVFYQTSMIIALWNDHPCGWCEQDLRQQIESMEEDLLDSEKSQKEYYQIEEWFK